MIETPCYNCHSARHTRYADENGFSLVKCCECGLLYVTPRPAEDEVAEAHKLGVHQGDSELLVTGSFNEAAIARYVAILKDMFGDALSKREIVWLDIGCGHGEFLTALRSFTQGSILARGVEPNEHKQRSARERGLDVSYFDLQSHARRYDFVSLLNVYSHLPDPPAFLSMCKGLLTPGGEILVQTGDTADLTADEHYRPLYLPDHLSFASERIVTGILQRCGFGIAQTRKYSAFPLDSTVGQWGKELVKLAWPGKRSQLPRLLGDFRKGRKYITDMYIRARLADSAATPPERT